MLKKNGFVAMVKSQKATGREVIGTVARVIPDNEKYQIKAIDDEAGTITLEQILPEDSEDEPKVVTITEANQIVAHYVTNPNERPAPEAEIQDRNGKKTLVLEPGTNAETPINMGSIKGLVVLGGIEGQVIFTVESDNEDKVNLMGYDVQTDSFYEITTESLLAEGVSFIAMDKDHTYIVENVVVDEEVLDDDGKPKKDDAGNVITEKVFKKASIFKIYVGRTDGSVRAYLDSQDYEPEYDEDEEDEDDEYEYETETVSTELGAPIKSMRLVEQAGRRDVVVVTESLEGEVRLNLYIDNGGSLGQRVGSFIVKSTDAKVFLGGSNDRPPVVTVKDDDQVLIRTGKGLLVVDDAEVVEALRGYNLFAGKFSSKDEDDREVDTYFYANADLQVVIFKVTNSDRGNLFELVA